MENGNLTDPNEPPHDPSSVMPHPPTNGKRMRKVGKEHRRPIPNNRLRGMFERTVGIQEEETSLDATEFMYSPGPTSQPTLIALASTASPTSVPTFSPTAEIRETASSFPTSAPSFGNFLTAAPTLGLDRTPSSLPTTLNQAMIDVPTSLPSSYPTFVPTASTDGHMIPIDLSFTASDELSRVNVALLVLSIVSVLAISIFTVRKLLCSSSAPSEANAPDCEEDNLLSRRQDAAEDNDRHRGRTHRSRKEKI